jgi:hypothetical protein
MASAMSAYEFPNIPPRALVMVRRILTMIHMKAIFCQSFGVEVFMKMDKCNKITSSKQDYHHSLLEV